MQGATETTDLGRGGNGGAGSSLWEHGAGPPLAVCSIGDAWGLLGRGTGTRGEVDGWGEARRRVVEFAAALLVGALVALSFAVVLWLVGHALGLA